MVVSGLAAGGEAASLTESGMTVLDSMGGELNVPSRIAGTAAFVEASL